jgi:hypothetical protein
MLRALQEGMGSTRIPETAFSLTFFRAIQSMKKTSGPQDAQTAEPRLYRVVADRIQTLIKADNIKAGTRLPAERELAATLNVSRASLREALIALELGGIVEVRGGSGVYVSEQATPESNMPEAGPGPFEVLAARKLIECEVAAIAAKGPIPVPYKKPVPAEITAALHRIRGYMEAQTPSTVVLTIDRRCRSPTSRSRWKDAVMAERRRRLRPAGLRDGRGPRRHAESRRSHRRQALHRT